MSLDRDRDRESRAARKRPPMSPRTMKIVIGIAAAILVFVIIVSIFAGVKFF